MFLKMMFDGYVDVGEDKNLLQQQSDGNAESESGLPCFRWGWLSAAGTIVMLAGVVALVGSAVTHAPSENSLRASQHQLRSDAKGHHGLALPASIESPQSLGHPSPKTMEGGDAVPPSPVESEGQHQASASEKESENVKQEASEIAEVPKMAATTQKPANKIGVVKHTTATPKSTSAATTAAPTRGSTAAPKHNTSQTDAKPKLKEPVLPPIQRCSWANEDCHTTKCCSNIECDKNFQNCQGFQCFKKDKWDGGYAGCKLGAPADWLGTVLGGAIVPREIKPAPEDTQTQGTSLFCFSVVMWNLPPSAGYYDSEANLANNWKRQGLGILHCDDHMIVDGLPAPRSGWGSTANIDVFIKYWQQVHDDGRYKSHDWIAKVDTDAVFFPARLKLHLQNLRTPKGSRVFLLNNGYKFKFMGALEVMTREAADLYYENAARCSSGEGGHSGGEDYYMKSCLIGIGVDIQVDETLLYDKYAAQNGCGDGWAACFHFYKTVAEWNGCHGEALNAQKAHDDAWNAEH
mmetsp:Transcript_123322/g.310409  ORF Transcript_123322/g.310409 Transcript_123322/m.310409 type:complete len:519 (+) Transcript_123322:37-1593(+)